MLKKPACFLFVTILAFTAFSGPAEAGEYFRNMKRDFARGSLNIVTFPLEIPMTFQRYHEASGAPVARHMAGLADGIWRGVARCGSGFWDFAAAITPGIQEGLPADPETLF